jgi:hypothetical protein
VNNISESPLKSRVSFGRHLGKTHAITKFSSKRHLRSLHPNAGSEFETKQNTKKLANCTKNLMSWQGFYLLQFSGEDL